jgi:hypothetical protein
MANGANGIIDKCEEGYIGSHTSWLFFFSSLFPLYMLSSDHYDITIGNTTIIAIDADFSDLQPFKLGWFRCPFPGHIPPLLSPPSSPP